MKFDITENIAISAGAGSGKTYTLSRRYINILLGFNLFVETNEPVLDIADAEPTLPEEIVTITYTEAGALEMRGRIFELIQKIIAYIDGKLGSDDGDFDSIKKAVGRFESNGASLDYIRNTLQEALEHLPDAVISTIHAYCLHLIDRYGDYLGLDVRPSVVGDDEKTAIFDDVYKEVTNRQSPLVEEIDQTVPFYKLAGIARKYSFDAGFRRAFVAYAQEIAAGGIDLQKLWLAMQLEEHLDAIADGLSAAKEMAKLDERKVVYYEALLHNFGVIVSMEGEFHSYEGQLRANKKLDKALLNRVRAAKDAIGALYATVVDSEAEEHYKETLLQIASLLASVHSAYGDALKEKGYTDFETILEYADRLLQKEIPVDTRYFMVDEFQDTNDFQWGIITKAAAKQNANLFIVGDEKQSIFSFQGADVTVFGRAREQMQAKTLTMTLNRRSDKAVIEMVNRVFSEVMQTELPQNEKTDWSQRVEACEAEIRPLLQEAVDLLASAKMDEGFKTAYTPLDYMPKRSGGSVELLVTPLDHTKEGCETECDESEQEMRHIASYIKQAVTTEMHPQIKALYDKGEKAIAVLFDTRKQMLLLKRKLAELGIAAKVADSGNFYDTKEINDIFIVLKLLALLPLEEELVPKQKYVVAGALRSNILRLSGDEIDEILRKKGKLPEILDRWKRLSQRVDPAELIATIVKESELLHIYRQLEDYAQRVANIDMLIGEAERFAEQNGGALSHYVEDLERLIHDENVESEEAFVIEEGVGSIEIRTMHSSKGLEWPMVILGSTQRSFMGMQPSESLVFDQFDGHEIVGFKVGDYAPLAYRFVKERKKLKHIEERKRLLYVAMTRPENILVISAVLHKNDKGAIKLCSRCGENSYFSLINKALNLELEELWDDEAKEKAFEEITVRYPAEWEGKESIIEKAPICIPPQFQPLHFSDRHIVRPSGTPSPLSFLAPDLFDAASAGTVVHKIIEKCWKSLDDDACIEKWLSEYDVPQEWKERIVKMAQAFKQSPHFKKVMEGAEAYFEYDYTYTNQDGKRVFGSIDLLYYDETKEGWVIVDFKTTALKGMSHEEAMHAHGYDAQLDAYAEYVETLLGKGSVAAKEVCWLGELSRL